MSKVFNMVQGGALMKGGGGRSLGLGHVTERVFAFSCLGTTCPRKMDNHLIYQ